MTIRKRSQHSIRKIEKILLTEICPCIKTTIYTTFTNKRSYWASWPYMSQKAQNKNVTKKLLWITTILKRKFTMRQINGRQKSVTCKAHSKRKIIVQLWVEKQKAKIILKGTVSQSMKVRNVQSQFGCRSFRIIQKQRTIQAHIRAYKPRHIWVGIRTLGYIEPRSKFKFWWNRVEIPDYANLQKPF